jgi:hypothetical protein
VDDEANGQLKDGDSATEKRSVPIAWEALEDAFENNAPEVHSYLHMATGEVIRVVDGIADPGTHARISTDSTYLRIDPVSSREQYRWMERFIAIVEEGPLRQKLLQSIDGKGAFRRFKDVLMAFPVDRERWFQFRSERLRACMEAWLDAQGVEPIERPAWEVPAVDESKLDPSDKAARRAQRGSATDAQRRKLHEVIDTLPARELDTALAFMEFLRDRRPLPRPTGRDARDSEEPPEGGSSRAS